MDRLWISKIIGRVYGLSRRRNGSHHHEWDLLWARSPIRERHIRWQIWHSKLLVCGEPGLRRSRLDSINKYNTTWNNTSAEKRHQLSELLFTEQATAVLDAGSILGLPENLCSSSDVAMGSAWCLIFRIRQYNGCSNEIETKLRFNVHQTHYRSYWRRVFTGQMTQSTVSKDRRKIGPKD